MLSNGVLKLEDSSCLQYVPSKFIDDTQGSVLTCWQICSMQENGKEPETLP